ncbi:MAG: SIMPL domain-containing protein, partial [Pseudomonadota bacterium]
MSGWNWGAAIGGIAMAAGIAFAGLEVASGFVESKRASRTVVVKGLAEREVQADVASWRIPFRGQADTSAAAIQAAERSRGAVIAFAKRGGVAEEALSSEPYVLRIERSYVNTPTGQVERERFVAVGAVRLRTTNVAAIVGLAAETQTLLDQPARSACSH